MASNLIVMASNLLVMASNLLAMPSNLLAMPSSLLGNHREPRFLAKNLLCLLACLPACLLALALACLLSLACSCSCLLACSLFFSSDAPSLVHSSAFFRGPSHWLPYEKVKVRDRDGTDSPGPQSMSFRRHVLHSSSLQSRCLSGRSGEVRFRRRRCVQVSSAFGSGKRLID